MCSAWYAILSRRLHNTSLTISSDYEWDLRRAPCDTATALGPHHILTFYMDTVFPEVINVNKTHYFLLVNNGFVRGPIYRGAFTKDDKCKPVTLTVAMPNLITLNVDTNTPYKQRFAYVKLPKVIASNVVSKLEAMQTLHPESLRRSLAQQEHFSPLFDAKFQDNALTPGYAAKDVSPKYTQVA